MNELVLAEAVGALPRSSDSREWDERERALALTLGLAVERRNGSVDVADRGTIEVFLAQCQRTQLDPVARQIYCIKRGNKWGVQISIDGARLVAERSGEYEGQTPVQWTGDGITWADVWLAEEPPRAARVGVYRRGFRDALFATARWESYAVHNDEWIDGRKTGNTVLSPMWKKMPDLMLGKVAEMLALRKAFPHDLSGLYSSEEMGQAGGVAPAGSPHAAPVPFPEPSGEAERRVNAAAAVASLGPDAVANMAAREDQTRSGGDAIEAEVMPEPATVHPPAAQAEPEFDAAAWELRVESATSVEGLRTVWDEAEAAGVLGAPVQGGSTQLGTLIMVRRDQLGGGES